MIERAHSPDFSRYPALWLALSFAIGVLAANLMVVGLLTALAAAAVLAAAAIAVPRRRLASVCLLLAFTAAGAASVRIQNSAITENRLRSLYDSGEMRTGDPVELDGVLMSAPEPSFDGVFLSLRVESAFYLGSERSVTGTVRLFLQQSKTADDISSPQFRISDLKYGSRIRVATVLNREDEYLNPGVVQRREFLDLAGIDATGSIKSPRLIEMIADESVFMPLAWVYDQRARAISELNDNLDGPAAGVMIASLLGDKYFLDKATGDLFREGGTFHILVISGLHITFIGALLLFIVSKFTRDRWTRFIVPFAILWAYTLAVGADVPVIRAAAMFSIISFSYVIYRQRSLLNAFGVCALLLLFWRPSDLFSPSFQLTFISVAAIIGMAFPLTEHLRAIGRWMPSAVEPFPPDVPSWLRRGCEMLYWNPDAWSVEQGRQIWSMNLFKSPYLARYIAGGVQSAVAYLFEGILVSLIVQLWMLPLLVVYFHRISIASIILNLWVGVFVALESFAAVTGVLIGRISDLAASPFYDLANLINQIMLVLPERVVDIGWASFRLPAYSGPGRAVYLIYFLPVVYLAWASGSWLPFQLKSRRGMASPARAYAAVSVLTVAAGIIIFHPLSAPRADGRLHIDFLDVGQGDSAFVTFPNGVTLLVDGGGRVRYGSGDDEETEEAFEPDVRTVGEAVVSEFLWHEGYADIDFIMGSHADVDHMHGLSDVSRNFGVESAIFGRTPVRDPEFPALAEVLRRRGVPVSTFASGLRFSIGEVAVEVLYPPPSADPDAPSDNDNSLVVRLVYGNRSFLLTGDIERRAETELITSGVQLKADLIKVPHHGSRTSSTAEFVNSVGAKYAVISVGRSSPFGHPHPEVVDRWQTAGAEVLTTGARGTISVSTDGDDLELRTFTP